MKHILFLLLLSTAYGQQLTTLAKRIEKIRLAGSESDGIHVLYDEVKITRDDFVLMGADFSSARRNHPNITDDELAEFRWFATADNFRREDAGGNYHSTNGKIEVVYTNLVKKKYQCDPRETAWHYIRVMELRKQKIPVEERVEIMKREAKKQPWRVK